MQNFSLPNGGHRGKISVVDMVCLVFIGFLYPPLTWKVFSLRPEKFLKLYSFGGGRACFFLLCVVFGESHAKEGEIVLQHRVLAKASLEAS